MKERPILFSGPMVRALLAGTKTQTRRIVKARDLEWMDVHQGLREPDNAERCPYGQPGNRLWVRETWHDASSALHSCVLYRADGDELYGGKWCPSIHMPRWASRITLEVTGVRVDRLQDINEADARAEGITDGGCLNCGEPEPCNCAAPQPDARDAFVHLWMSINGPDSWAANPWVWVIEFRRLP